MNRVKLSPTANIAARRKSDGFIPISMSSSEDEDEDFADDSTSDDGRRRFSMSEKDFISLD